MPTIKQKRALMKIVENHGNVSQAMLAVGYDPSSAKNPKILTQSKGFQELLDQYLPDELLTNVHLQGLKATRIHTSHTEPDKEVPDFAVRHKYLDTAYKVKGKIKDDSSINIDKMMILRLDV